MVCCGGNVWCGDLVIDVLFDVFCVCLIVVVLLCVLFGMLIKCVEYIYIVDFVEQFGQLCVFFGQVVGVFLVVFLVFDVDFFVDDVDVVVQYDFVVFFVVQVFEVFYEQIYEVEFGLLVFFVVGA